MKMFLDYLYKLRNEGSSFGLERIRILLDRLNNPQGSYPVIHVAGTNGKGSVCAMLNSIYQSNGYKVGLFSSPHLIELGERVQVNGENMPMEEIKNMVLRIQPIAEEMESEIKGMHPTFFEIMTAVAFLRFKESKVDLAILETGLGGRLDSTNVVTPELSIITSISLDHCEILGHRISDIAREKGGIIKNKVPVVTGWLPQEANQEIKKISKQKNANVEDLNLSIEQCPETNLVGNYQRRNAALASTAVELLKTKFAVSNEDTEKGLKKVVLPGRWQKLRESPKIILDACHNQGGVECLKENLEVFQSPFKVWLAAMGGDRAFDLIRLLAPLAKELVYFTAEFPRACDFEQMLALTPKPYHSKVRRGNWKNIDLELKEAKKNNEEDLLVTGSIYLIGQVLSVQENPFLPTSSSLQDYV